MSDRARDMVVQILCETNSGMRAATEREQEQYRKNTGTNFDLLTVNDRPGHESHIARSQHASYFDFDRISRYDRNWFDQKLKDLPNGQPLSDLYSGRTPDDPMFKKAADILRSYAPQHVNAFMLHASAFKGFSLAMAGDLIDQAAFKDKSLEPEQYVQLNTYLGLLQSKEYALPDAARHIISDDQFRMLLTDIDQEMQAEVAYLVEELDVEEIDLGHTPPPGRFNL